MHRMGVVSTAVCAGGTDNLLSMTELVPFVNENWLLWENSARMRLGHLVLGALLISLPLRADDGAASVAAGGLVLMKREPRIVMAKEVLRISPQKVVVDYAFRNDSDQDITTSVAFPVPPYRFGEDETVAGDPAFKDFELSVDGEPGRFAVQVRALVGERDISPAFAGQRR